MPKKHRTNSVNFPPPQVPSQNPTPPPPPPPRAITRKPPQRNSYKPNNNPFVFSNAIIAINLGLFVWSQISGVNRFQYNMFLSRIFLDNGEWYRIISSGFLHFGLIHVGMNMLLLWQLGQLLEPALGRARFTLLYFTAMVGGATGALLMNPNGLTGGASGAVFGLMAAAAVGFQQRGVNPMRTGIGATLMLNLLITFAIPGISIGGHLGGALVGGVIGYAMLEPKWQRDAPWIAWVAPVICIASSLLFISTF